MSPSKGAHGMLLDRRATAATHLGDDGLSTCDPQPAGNLCCRKRVCYGNSHTAGQQDAQKGHHCLG